MKDDLAKRLQYIKRKAEWALKVLRLDITPYAHIEIKANLAPALFTDYREVIERLVAEHWDSHTIGYAATCGFSLHNADEHERRLIGTRTPVTDVTNIDLSWKDGNRKLTLTLAQVALAAAMCDVVWEHLHATPGMPHHKREARRQKSRTELRAT